MFRSSSSATAGTVVHAPPCAGLRRAAGQGVPYRRAEGRGARSHGASHSPSPTTRTSTELDARNATAPPRFEVKAPQGAPNVIIFLIDDIGFGHPSTFGGAIPMPTLDALASQGLQLQPLPHHGALLAHARGAPHRPQPPHEQRRRHHGDRHRLPRQHRRAAAERHAARRDPAAERLQHGRFRQVPRDGAVGGQRLRAVRSLAHPLRLRQVLRLHRRRDQPVGAADLRRHRSRSRCRATRTTTSPPT